MSELTLRDLMLIKECIRKDILDGLRDLKDYEKMDVVQNSDLYATLQRIDGMIARQCRPNTDTIDLLCFNDRLSAIEKRLDEMDAKKG